LSRINSVAHTVTSLGHHNPPLAADVQQVKR